MKSIGVTRAIDSLGRVVIPKSIRRNLDLNEGDPMEVFIDGETVIFKKHNPGCMECGEMKDLKEVFGKKICPKCLEEYRKASEEIDKLRKVE